MINTNPALNHNNRTSDRQNGSTLLRQLESQSRNFSQQSGSQQQGLGFQNSATLASLLQLILQLLRQLQEQPQPDPLPDPDPKPQPDPDPLPEPEQKPLDLTSEQREAIQDHYGIFGEQGFSVIDKDNNKQLSAGDVVSISGGVTGGHIRDITVTAADVNAISGQDLADAEADFLKNKEKWESTRPDNYSYTLERSGFITPVARQPVDITVNDNQVVKAEWVQTGGPADGDNGAGIPEFNKLSINDLFDRIEQGINSGAAEVRVEYDAQTGAPTSIFIDQDKRLADEELFLSASNFKALDTNPNPNPNPSDIVGTDGDDTLNGTAKDERISGLAGNDRINGRQGDDFLFGDAGNDRLYGGRGDDTLSGGDGNDYLSGSTGNNRLFGGAGDDKLASRLGSDFLDGGSGNDTARIRGNIDNYSIELATIFPQGINPEDQVVQGAPENNGFILTNKETGQTISAVNIEEFRFNDARLSADELLERIEGEVETGIVKGGGVSVGGTLNNNESIPNDRIVDINGENYSVGFLKEQVEDYAGSSYPPTGAVDTGFGVHQWGTSNSFAAGRAFESYIADTFPQGEPGLTEPTGLNLTQEQQNAIGARFNRRPPPNLADAPTTQYTGVTIDKNGDGKLSEGDVVKLRDVGGFRLEGTDKNITRDHVLTAADIIFIESDRSNPLLDISGGLSDEQSQRLIDAIFPDQVGLHISDEVTTIASVFDHNSDGKLSVGDSIQIQRSNGEAPEGLGVSINFHTLTQAELDRYLEGSNDNQAVPAVQFENNNIIV